MLERADWVVNDLWGCEFAQKGHIISTLALSIIEKGFRLRICAKLGGIFRIVLKYDSTGITNRAAEVIDALKQAKAIGTLANCGPSEPLPAEIFR